MPAKLQFGALVVLLALGAPGHAADRNAADATASAPIADSSRIVSIGGAITEILYALGEQQKIVGVDTTSLYPESVLREKPNVGYMRQLSAEGVLALSPTLILAIEGSGPKETIDVLRRATVPFVVIPDRYTGEGITDKIMTIASDVGVPERGACLAGEVQSDLAALDAVRRQIARRIKVAFLLSLANNRPMVSGRDTAADAIITMAGADNAFADFAGYKLVNDEALIAAKPEAILVMQRGAQALSADTVFSQPALAMTPAAAHQTLIAMDGLYLLGFGPRTARAARDLAKRLYPEIAVNSLPSEQAAGRHSCDQ